MKSRAQKQPGFTLVELLIVIIVIAILATISVLAYNHVQERARDSQRKTDLETMTKAFEMWNMDNPEHQFMTGGSGCGGSSGSGHAWFNHQAGTGYPKSMNDCFKEAGYINEDLIDPSGMTVCNSGAPEKCFSYMKCTSVSRGTYLFAHLETLPDATDEADDTCAASWDTGYGMNYVIKIG